VRGDRIGQLIEAQARQIEPALAAVDQQTRIDLPLHAGDEIGRALDIERHDDDATRQRAKESGHPLGAVLTPQEDALAFGNAAPFEFARELKRRVAQPSVRPALRSQAAPVRQRRLRAVRGGGVEKADERRSHRLYDKTRGAAAAIAVVTLDGGVTRGVCRDFAPCCNMTD
jgi:hypothetical protein